MSAMRPRRVTVVASIGHDRRSIRLRKIPGTGSCRRRCTMQSVDPMSHAVESRGKGRALDLAAPKGVHLQGPNGPIRLKWHRLRRTSGDVDFTLARLREGLAVGASMEVDLRR